MGIGFSWFTPCAQCAVEENRLPQIIRLALCCFSIFFACLARPLENMLIFLQTLVWSPIHTLLLPAPSCRTHSPSPLSSWSWSWTRCQRGRSTMVSVPLRMVDAQLRTMMSPLSTRCPPPVWSGGQPSHRHSCLSKPAPYWALWRPEMKKLVYLLGPWGNDQSAVGATEKLWSGFQETKSGDVGGCAPTCESVSN